MDISGFTPLPLARPFKIDLPMDDGSTLSGEVVAMAAMPKMIGWFVLNEVDGYLTLVEADIRFPNGTHIREATGEDSSWRPAPGVTDDLLDKPF